MRGGDAPHAKPTGEDLFKGSALGDTLSGPQILSTYYP